MRAGAGAKAVNTPIPQLWANAVTAKVGLPQKDSGSFEVPLVLGLSYFLTEGKEQQRLLLLKTRFSGLA